MHIVTVLAASPSLYAKSVWALLGQAASSKDNLIIRDDKSRYQARLVSLGVLPSVSAKVAVQRNAAGGLRAGRDGVEE